MPRVLITAALLMEARAIARAFGLKGRFNARVEMDDAGEIGVALVGPRGKYIDEARALGTRDGKLQGIVMAGVAGALSPELKVGDVVIQGDLRDHGLLMKEGVRMGRIVTSRDIVGTPAEKTRLFKETGALAVDMETEVAQEVARQMGVNFLALRAISDAAADSLDPELLKLVDAEGKPRISRAALHVARHPGKLRGLLNIRAASERALSSLTAVLLDVMASGWPAA